MSIDRRPFISSLFLVCLAACNGGGSATRLSLVLETHDYAHAHAGSFDLATGTVAFAPGDLPDSDSVPVRFGDTSGVLLRKSGQLAILSPDLLSVTRMIDVNDPGMTGMYASNPQAVVSVSATKAYVTRLALNSILVIDPTKSGTDAQLRTIDLSGFVLPADMDHVVDASAAIIIGTRAYVALGRYYTDSTTFSSVYPDASLIAVIDTATDTLVDADSVAMGVQPIILEQRGPIDLASLNGKLIVGSNGVYGSNDAGVEIVDVGTFSTRTLVNEMTLGGDVGGVEIAGGKLLVQVGFFTGMTLDGKVVIVDAGSGALVSTLAPANVTGMQATSGDGVAVGLGDHLALYDADDGSITRSSTTFEMMLALAGMASAN